jgi:D-arabinose 5-phosphate isomerase GutQ
MRWARGWRIYCLAAARRPCLFNPGDSQHGLSGAVITARDVLIALSKGGETVEVNFLARWPKKKARKVDLPSPRSLNRDPG